MTLDICLCREVPKFAFPFVRQILADLIQTGGFPPLLLNPVDFKELYIKSFSKELEGEDKEKIAAL